MVNPDHAVHRDRTDDRGENQPPINHEQRDDQYGEIDQQLKLPGFQPEAILQVEREDVDAAQARLMTERIRKPMPSRSPPMIAA